MNSNISKEIVLKCSSNKWLKEKLSRFKPIVFLRKRLLLTIFTSIFILSLLIGFWDISKFSLYNQNGKILEGDISREILSYLEENVSGKNFLRLN